MTGVVKREIPTQSKFFKEPENREIMTRIKDKG